VVTKYNDENGNGKRDEGEKTLSGWDMNLQQLEGPTTTQTTGEDGTTTFNDMVAGSYVLTEELQEGWKQTELRCEDMTPRDEMPSLTLASRVYAQEAPGYITLEGGQTVECVVGNQFINPDLIITKNNDTGGSDRSQGGSVTFTITVTATQSAVQNVFVTDLPAGGFTYRPGSWTALSTIRGDLKALAFTPEPTYASPGKWSLGTMQADEVVTLTYIADISSSQHPGLYRDLAVAYGDDLLGGQVLSNDDGTPQYFVGTEVNVVKNDQSGASVNVKQTIEGQVLGASTELPATGANSVWLMIAVILMSLGGVSAVAGWLVRRKYV